MNILYIYIYNIHILYIYIYIHIHIRNHIMCRYRQSITSDVEIRKFWAADHDVDLHLDWRHASQVQTPKAHRDG